MDVNKSRRKSESLMELPRHTETDDLMSTDDDHVILIDRTMPNRVAMLNRMDKRFDMTLKRLEPMFGKALQAIWQYLPQDKEYDKLRPSLENINLVHFMTSYAVMGLKEKVLSRQTAMCKELEERATDMQILFDALVFKVMRHQDEPATNAPPSPKEIRVLHRVILNYCATFRAWKATDNVHLADIIRRRLVHMYAMMQDATERCNALRAQIQHHRTVLARVASRDEVSAFDRGNPPPQCLALTQGAPARVAHPTPCEPAPATLSGPE